ncbi:preprotein translocase subunit SecG [Paracoccus sp. JM45]|uniref:preprotein translocase subunit SecG n=1 Tax=Paracoccus sp. JM45 TaxID=2283626 RepID=UPI000E6D5712|nr:preprotein translocase subunit SecG [Paracoccus sp. JM45]RJE80566.1 preprotein translocase subunit SecG [Paracoccus sp. JM45]
MENVILTVHLILAVLLTGVVLLQRSEGGGLGMGGGGGGGGGVMTGRQAANAMTRLAWIFGIALFCTSITLTILAAREASNGSIMDQFGGTESQEQPAGNLPSVPSYTPPPSTSGNPLTPPAPDAQAPAATTEAPAAPASDVEAPAAAPATPEAASTETQPAN